MIRFITFERNWSSKNKIWKTHATFMFFKLFRSGNLLLQFQFSWTCIKKWRKVLKVDSKMTTLKICETQNYDLCCELLELSSEVSLLLNSRRVCQILIRTVAVTIKAPVTSNSCEHLMNDIASCTVQAINFFVDNFWLRLIHVRSRTEEVCRLHRLRFNSLITDSGTCEGSAMNSNRWAKNRNLLQK